MTCVEWSVILENVPPGPERFRLKTEAFADIYGETTPDRMTVGEAYRAARLVRLELPPLKQVAR